MASWTQVVFAQGSPTCLLIGQEHSIGMWKHHLETDCATAVLFKDGLLTMLQVIAEFAYYRLASTYKVFSGRMLNLQFQHA